MSSVELNDQTLDSYDVLRRELRDKFKGETIEDFEVQKDGSVKIRMEAVVGNFGPITLWKNRYITATFKRGNWKLTGDID